MSSRKTRAILVVATMAVAGCTLNRSTVRRTTETFFGQIGKPGTIIEPKRCHVTVAYLSKPLNDRAVNEAIWATADEQSVPGDARRVLEANGLRLGVLTGGLPAEVQAVLHAPPPNKVEPSEFNLPDGSNTLITLADPKPSVSMFLTLDHRALGKDYKEASGWLRLTSSHEGPTGVSLRLVPEIHHGPVLRRYDTLPNNNGTITPMQFMLKDGQQEDTLRDLAATITLQSGQVAVVGCLPDRPGSLGTFLFTHHEANSDRVIQKVLLIWARRSNPGAPGSQPTPETPLEAVDPPELPALFRRDPDRDRSVSPARNDRPTTPSKIDDAVIPVSSRG